MKIVSMCSFWDEDFRLVESCFNGMSRLGVTHIVAVDGVLDLYPGGEANTNRGVYAQMIRAADDYGMELLLYRNQERWTGNEVSKRQVMLDLALSLTTAEDWLLIWDTDYVLQQSCPTQDSLYAALENTDLNFADVSYGEDPNHLYRARLLMRAQRGLHLRTNHYAYYPDLKLNPQEYRWYAGSWFLPDNRSDGRENPPALQLPGIRVHHDRDLRPKERLEGRTVFYERRDQGKVEW